MSAPSLSDKQVEETLAAIEQCKHPDGSINKSKLGDVLGISRGSAQNRVRSLARTGRLGFAPVMPGFEVAKVSTQADENGQVVKTFVQQRPERGEPFKVPDGHRVKGVSSLIDADGRTVQSWVKTSEGQIDPKAFAAEIRAHFDNWSPSYIPAPAAKSCDQSRLAFYPVSDLHVGMFSWGKETGENWDLRIARKFILETYAELIRQTPRTDEGVVLFGGDQQHADFFTAQTEKSGHLLDVDGRFPKVHLTLCEIAVEIVTRARSRHRKVRVRVLQGNHDRHSSIALAHFLYAWFKKDNNVIVDLSPSLYWFHKFGQTLLCAVHGHTIKARDLAGKVAAAQPVLWGESIFRYAHYFHEHHDEIVCKDGSGLKVEKHAIIAPADAYHAGGAHHAFRNAKSILYDQRTGEHWRSTINIIPEYARGSNDPPQAG